MIRALLKQGAVFTAALTLCILVSGSGVTHSQANPPAAQKFDDFGDINTDDRQAHLDLFAQQLSKESSSRGFIIGYRREDVSAGFFLRYVHGFRKYLVNQRGVPTESV